MESALRAVLCSVIVIRTFRNSCDFFLEIENASPSQADTNLFYFDDKSV